MKSSFFIPVTAANYFHRNQQKRRGDGGYALVSLIALMSIVAVLLLAVAPNFRQQAQREREFDAMVRGEEIAEAIRLYILEKRTLPTSMEQLTEGLPRGTKKLQIMRAYAAVDPLTESGEWKRLRAKGPEMLEFQRQVMLYNGGRMPDTRDAERVPNVYTQVLTRMNNLVEDDDSSEGSAPGGEDDSENTIGPFIGVVSRSRRNAVVYYYGIDRHDQWVFTPLFRK